MNGYRQHLLSTGSLRSDAIRMYRTRYDRAVTVWTVFLEGEPLISKGFLANNRATLPYFRPALQPCPWRLIGQF